jgi:hypothetical protein
MAFIDRALHSHKTCASNARTERVACAIIAPGANSTMLHFLAPQVCLARHVEISIRKR